MCTSPSERAKANPASEVDWPVVTRVSEFRKDLYKGTAPYYDHNGPAYPAPLFDDLRQRTSMVGGGRLLSLACGTGQIAFARARHFGEVWAVDQEPESVAYGNRGDTLRLLVLDIVSQSRRLARPIRRV